MIRLHPDDIRAIAEQVVVMMQGEVTVNVSQAPVDSIQAIQRRALDLARQGKRAESIELMRTITRLGVSDGKRGTRRTMPESV